FFFNAPPTTSIYSLSLHDALPISRRVCARRNSLLTQFANVPVLFVRHVPEFDRVLRFEIVLLEGVRMKKPIADNPCSLWRLRPEIGRAHVCTPVTSLSRMPSSA